MLSSVSTASLHDLDFDAARKGFAHGSSHGVLRSVNSGESRDTKGASIFGAGRLKHH